MPATERALVGSSWTNEQPSGTLLLETCHRVELYGSSTALADFASHAPAGVRRLEGRDAAEHLVRVAVGRDSAVVAEDQILHQLRVAAHTARAGDGLSSDLDRLLDLALSAGRRARSWLPARRPSLMDLALTRVSGKQDLHGQKLLVVGTGEMGRAAIVHLQARGAWLSVASRSRDGARMAAQKFAIADVEFDPGPATLAQAAGVIVALKGRWTIGPATRDAMLASGTWVLDVSSPPALADDIVAALGERLLTIDDLATARPSDAASDRLLARLDALMADTVEQFGQWTASESSRDAAEALTSWARAAQSAELERLWRRVPTLSITEREEVARALDHLTESLLREPLEQLGRDGDGRQIEAVRELFRL